MKITAVSVPVYSSDGTKLIGQLETDQQVINLTESDGGVVIAYLLGLVKAKDAPSLVDKETWDRNACELEKFLSYAAAQTGCHYATGAQRQKTTSKLIRSLESNRENQRRAHTVFNKHVTEDKTFIANDGSGLVMAYLKNKANFVSSDKTANGIYYDLCTAIPVTDLRAGDLVFKKNRINNKMSHVGIYMGDGTVVHSKGRNSGVVREGYFAAGWKRYGRLKVFAEGLIKPAFWRELRLKAQNMMGDDVRTVQQALENKGFDTKGIDGVFGGNTYNALTEWQNAAGLTADGIVTRGVWEKLMA